MPKAIGLIVSVILMLLIFASCSSFIESDYISVAPHEEETSSDESSGDYISVKNYSALKNAIISMVKNGESSAIIRLENYDGDEETDIYQATYEIQNENALGAYVVKYFRFGGVSQVLGYYEFELNISYKRTAEEIDNIITATSADMVRQVIGTALKNRETNLALMISSQDVQESIVGETLESYYIQNPLNLLLPPAYTTALYPNTGSQQILEIYFTYSYTEEDSVSMLETLNNRAQELISVNADSVARQVLGVSQSIVDSTTYLGEEEVWYNTSAEKPVTSTAYGALVNRSAVSEGFAMGFKAAMEQLGVNCSVVEGRLDSALHYWNIVEIDGAYYHIDLTMCKTEGFAYGFLKNDSDMFARYWWDTGAYSKCVGDLTYTSVIESNA